MVTFGGFTFGGDGVDGFFAGGLPGPFELFEFGKVLLV
jgi:hypothetical protein